MAATMLIISYLPSAAQMDAGPDEWTAIANHIAEVDGLRWKYWLRSRDGETHSGIYLFDSLDQATEGSKQLETSLRDAGSTRVESRLYDIDARLSALTRGGVR